MTIKDEKDDWETLFAGAEVIHCYTRREALADGVLVDVTELAREAGFRFPVAVTHAVWASYVAVPKGVSGQCEKGRLWDILWMTRCAAAQSHGREMAVKLFVRNADNTEPELVRLKALCHPGDDGEAVITIMLPDED